MRIQSVRIKNLRAYQDETVEFDSYTCLVGANGAGKSTVLCALNIFFREIENTSTNLSNLDKEDFHRGNVDEPIEITVTFADLSREAQEAFADYYRQGVLMVTARADYDPASGAATVKQYGNRLAMEEFAPYFKRNGDGAKADELKAAYAALRQQFTDLPASAKTKGDMADALRAYEAERVDQCKPIPSEDQFYGATHGQGRLREFVQWVYVPAVKDAAGEQAEAKNTALGRLLARTVRSQVSFSDRLIELRAQAEANYREMLALQQGTLDDISRDLQNRLAEWSHPEATAKLQWHQDPKSSIRIEEPVARLLAGDGEFEGSIARFGHGMQRSYIIALLQGLSVADAAGPRLLLGIEEPELYQHPPQARHLASVLQELSRNGAQVIASTHSPYFVDGTTFERVRLVRKRRNEGRATVHSCSVDRLGQRYAAVTGDRPTAQEGVLAKLHQVMQPHLSEMFFTPKLILVEGLEDAAYINAWMVLSERWESFRARGAHIVAVNGKSELIRPLIIAQQLQIPTFVIFDCDGDKLTHNNPDQQRSIEASHRRDNSALFHLAGMQQQDPFPTDAVWSESLVAWPHDLGKCVEVDAGAHWQPAGSRASANYGNVSGLKKNTLHIGARLKELQNLRANTATLDRLCETILTFANRA
ncbi:MULTISPECIES: ATP-dependent nuclease [Bradyrhizobium]|uniref:ATP-dependent nuclease n=1 Tax=Bradyrhizobium TaxID=374 RepID=UPI0004B68BF6|nr:MULTISPECIES: AAA family ATPase [Bradyrhizobium]MBR1366861.1 AAA family ATPase [Bradyrhizobium ottawaense]